MRSQRIPKYKWLPVILFLYFAGMSIYFGKDLILSGQYLRFTIISVVEILVIIAVYFTQKGKYKAEQRRKEEEKNF